MASRHSAEGSSTSEPWNLGNWFWVNSLITRTRGRLTGNWVPTAPRFHAQNPKDANPEDPLQLGNLGTLDGFSPKNAKSDKFQVKVHLATLCQKPGVLERLHPMVPSKPRYLWWGRLASLPTVKSGRHCSDSQMTV